MRGTESQSSRVQFPNLKTLSQYQNKKQNIGINSSWKSVQFDRNVKAKFLNIHFELAANFWITPLLNPHRKRSFSRYSKLQLVLVWRKQNFTVKLWFLPASARAKGLLVRANSRETISFETSEQRSAGVCFLALVGRPFFLRSPTGRWYYIIIKRART